MNSPVSQAAEFPASTQSVLREPAPLPASKKVWHNPMMVPLRPVASRHRWFLGFCFFVLFFALWALVTLPGWCRRHSLPVRPVCCRKGAVIYRF